MLSLPGPAGQKGAPMNQLTFSIGPTPATLRGPESGSVFLFVHSPGGNRRETAPFAELAVPLGWQVLSVDLPEHGGRQDGAPLLPWAAVPELQAVDALEEPVPGGVSGGASPSVSGRSKLPEDMIAEMSPFTTPRISASTKPEIRPRTRPFT